MIARERAGPGRGAIPDDRVERLRDMSRHRRPDGAQPDEPNPFRH
jgi:hypothetical protein